MKHPYSATFFYTQLLCIMLMLCARISYGTVVTSVASGDWTNTATWNCGCIPDSTDAVIITASYTVTLTAADTIQAITIDLNGVLDNAGFVLNLKEISPGAGTTLTINGQLNGTGATKWLTNTDAATTIIDGTGSITSAFTFTSASAGATINAGANLTFNGTSNRILVQGGTLYCFGTITLPNGHILASGKTVQVESSGRIILNTGNINMGSNGKVYNYGEVTVVGNIAGVSGASWNNYDNSSLTIAGAFTASNLYANYPGNTVNYNGVGNQSIKNTQTVGYEGYWNLKCSNSGQKTINSGSSINLTVHGDLTIQDNAQFYLNSLYADALTLFGNWVNTSAHADPFVDFSISVTFQGTSMQSISSVVTGGETFYRLTNNGAGLTLNNCNVNISTELVLSSGLINTNSYEINVTNTSTWAISINSGSYINGNLKRRIDRAGGVFDFPVGNANAYELATVNFTAAHTVDSLLVNFSNPTSSNTGLPLTDASGQYISVLNCGGAASGAGNANDGVWTITPNTGTATYDITLYGNNYDNQQAAHTVLKRTDASSAWELAGTYQWSNLTEPIVAARTSLSGFSQFAIGASANALPIELLDFKALAIGGKVELSWTTATETNNDYFTVERGASPLSGGDVQRTEGVGVTFVSIGTVKGAGNSTAPLYYHLLDESPSPSERAGVRYYRLKQTDYDGKFSYSKIVSVNLLNSLTFTIYPNPATDNVNLNIPGEKEEQLFLTVVDKLGRTIINTEESMKDGINSFNLDVSRLNTGVYFLQIITPSGVKEQKQLMINKKQ